MALGINPISMTMPNDYSAEQAAILRRQKLAELMQQQSMQPIEAGASQGPLGSVTAPMSWTQGLAKLMQAYSGQKGMERAEERQKALGQKYQTEGQDALIRGLKAYKGTPEQTIQPDPQEAQQTADFGTPPVGPANVPAVPGSPETAMGIWGSHPMTQGTSQAMLAHLLKGEDPYSLKQGEKRFGPGGKVVAENAPKPTEHVIEGKVYRTAPTGLEEVGGPGKPIDYNKPFLPDGSPNPAYQEFAMKKSRAGAPQMAVQIAQEKAFEGELGKKQAESLIEGRKAADDAAQIINTVNVGRKIMKEGMVTGFGANAIVSVGQALKQAGIDFGGDATANAQAYTAAMAGNVGKIIKQFGSGTGLSDADREYAIRMAGGQITLDKNAITRILDINEKAARNVLKVHNRRAEGIKSNIPLKVDEPQAEGQWSVVR